MTQSSCPNTRVAKVQTPFIDGDKFTLLLDS